MMCDRAAFVHVAGRLGPRIVPIVVAVAAVFAGAPAFAQAPEAAAVLGRWDLRVSGPDGTYPSWLEVTESGRGVLVGRFTGRVGSARPIGRVAWDGTTLRFSIPPQWEVGSADLALEARTAADGLSGTLTTPAGERHAFVARRAPALRRPAPDWASPVPLFNGRDLTGWTAEGSGESHWVADAGVLKNTSSGANLRTTRTFDDFKLHLEFRYPEGGNSGVYLRGRHEVQIEDSRERDWPASTHVGGVYGFLAPSENAATGPGEWQTYDITLVGRRVTVVLNGTPIIVDQVIPGITGGALDSDEGEPGPILLQGDHTSVEFRNITVAVPAGGRGR